MKRIVFDVFFILVILGAMYVLLCVVTGCSSVNSLTGVGQFAPIRHTGAAYLRSCIYEDGQACCLYSNSVSMHEEVWCKPAVFGDWKKVGENDWNESQ